MFKKAVFLLIAGALIFGSAIYYYRGCNTIHVTTVEFRFTPDAWTVYAGRPVKITITNNGYASHQWILLKHPNPTEQPSEDDIEDEAFWEIEVQPGETMTETFTAPSEPGDYPVVCSLPGHLERGMEATLVVK